MRKKSHIVQTPEDLKSFAGRFIREKALEPRAGALVVALIGNLGAGKTTFVQGAARQLGYTRSMPSPTFTIMRDVALSEERYGIATIYHFDWFRLQSKEDVLALGWEDIITDPQGLVLVEWGDRFEPLFPEGAHRVTLRHHDGSREITTSVL